MVLTKPEPQKLAQKIPGEVLKAIKSLLSPHVEKTPQVPGASSGQGEPKCYSELRTSNIERFLCHSAPASVQTWCLASARESRTGLVIECTIQSNSPDI